MTEIVPHTDAIFGSILTGHDNVVDVTNLLQRWLPSYLYATMRIHDLDPSLIAPPASWSWSARFRKWQTQQLPAIVVVTPGTTGKPTQRGDGSMTMKWDVGIAAVCMGQTENDADQAAKMYAAAIRTLLVQKQSLEAGALGVEWLGERYDDVPDDQGRSLRGSQSLFSIERDNVSWSKRGPVTPSDPPVDPTQPFADWPTVETYDNTITLKGLNQDVTDN